MLFEIIFVIFGCMLLMVCSLLDDHFNNIEDNQ